MSKSGALTLKVLTGLTVLILGAWTLPSWSGWSESQVEESTSVTVMWQGDDGFEIPTMKSPEYDEWDAAGVASQAMQCMGDLCATGATMAGNGLNFVKQWATGELQEQRDVPVILALQLALGQVNSGKADYNAGEIIDTVRYYLTDGKASSNATMPDGTPVLHVATRLAIVDDDFIPLVKLFVKQGADLSAQNAQQNIALHEAIAGDCIECVKALADAMANPRFWHRCREGICKLASFGLYKSTPLTVKNSAGVTPLQMVIEKESGKKLPMLRALLKFNDQLAWWDKEQVLLQAFAANNKHAMQALNSANIANWQGLLHHIEQKGNEPSLGPVLRRMLADRLLSFVKLGVLDANTTDNSTNNNLLHELARRNNSDWHTFTSALFAQNSRSKEFINAKNSANETALQSGVDQYNVKFVELLLQQMGRLISTDEIVIALELGVAQLNVELVKLLLEQASDRISAGEISKLLSELSTRSNRFSVFNFARSEIEELLNQELKRRARW